MHVFRVLASRRTWQLRDQRIAIALDEARQRHDDLVANQRTAEMGSADALRLREAAEVAATVSTALADQVLGALWELLRGFQAADEAAQVRLIDGVAASAHLAAAAVGYARTGEIAG